MAPHFNHPPEETAANREVRPISMDNSDIEMDEPLYASTADDDVEKALLPRCDSDANLTGNNNIDSHPGWWTNQNYTSRLRDSRFVAFLSKARSLTVPRSRRWPGIRRRSESMINEKTDRRSCGKTFSANIRTIFNYPSPDFKPRSTAWLDALRGVAAFNVFIYHYAEVWIEKEASWTDGPGNNPHAWWAAPFLRTWYDAGNAGVCLFFAISGYVLSYRILGLIRQRGRNEEVLSALSSSVLRRGIRLYMPVIVLTFLLMTWAYCTGFPLARPIDLQSNYWREIWRWYNELTHLWMPLRYPDRWQDILNPYDGTISWTIPLEYYGSITIYMALLLTSKITSFGVRASLFALLIYMYAVKDEWYVVQFFLGAIYAEYHLASVEKAQATDSNSNDYSSPRRRWRILLGKLSMISLLIFGVYLSGMPGKRLLEPDHRHSDASELEPRPFFDWMSFWVPKHWYETRQMDRYFWSFGANCIMVACGELPAIKALLDKRPFQWLGRISFGLYLCHMSTRGALRPLDGIWLKLVGLDASNGVAGQKAGARYAVAYFIRMVFSTPINLFVAGLFERWIDRPSVSLGRRFEKFIVRIGGDRDDGKLMAKDTAAASSQNNGEEQVRVVVPEMAS